jgi:hypothetical protein
VGDDGGQRRGLAAPRGAAGPRRERGAKGPAARPRHSSARMPLPGSRRAQTSTVAVATMSGCPACGAEATSSAVKTAVRRNQAVLGRIVEPAPGRGQAWWTGSKV